VILFQTHFGVKFDETSFELLEQMAGLRSILLIALYVGEITRDSPHLNAQTVHFAHQHCLVSLKCGHTHRVRASQSAKRADVVRVCGSLVSDAIDVLFELKLHLLAVLVD
jgi:hypothetical protein